MCDIFGFGSNELYRECLDAVENCPEKFNYCAVTGFYSNGKVAVNRYGTISRVGTDHSYIAGKKGAAVYDALRTSLYNKCVDIINTHKDCEKMVVGVAIEDVLFIRRILYRLDDVVHIPTGNIWFEGCDMVVELRCLALKKRYTYR